MKHEHTLEQCESAGRDHAAYGWTRSPWGDWNEQQMAAYNKGYYEQRELERAKEHNHDTQISQDT